MAKKTERLGLLFEARQIFARLKSYDRIERIHLINELRKELHKYSPLASEPVDCILWECSDRLEANDYNPNVVAPPEMKLLEHSIQADGYTQPIVAWRQNGKFEVVDGFHRTDIGRKSKAIRERTLGYLPIAVVNQNRTLRGDRIASTIRHNRARGKHQVQGMSEIVIELKARNWKNSRIARELGMDEDEILRLCQITGLQGLFSDQEFSKAWNVAGEITDLDYEELADDISTYEEGAKARTVNTSDENRIFHTYDKWECFKAGFYARKMEGMTRAECEEAYRDFLADLPRFEKALAHVTAEWKHSCEHYLTNIAMNRIAWLGQASMCYETGVPAVFRSGFYLLNQEQQEAANLAALKYLNRWLTANNRPKVSLDEAMSGDRQSDIY